MLGKHSTTELQPLPQPFKFQFYLETRHLNCLAGLKLAGLRVSPTDPSKSTSSLLSEVAHISWGQACCSLGKEVFCAHFLRSKGPGRTFILLSLWLLASQDRSHSEQQKHNSSWLKQNRNFITSCN